VQTGRFLFVAADSQIIIPGGFSRKEAREQSKAFAS